MPVLDRKVDAYIANAQPFAQPILRHLRELVHRLCPECREVMKWSFPNFEYHGPIMSMAAFKHHAAFGFWKAALLKDPKGVLSSETGMGHLGKLTEMADLPSDRDLEGLIRQAMKLNEAGTKVPKPKAAQKPEAPVPDYFARALKKNVMARKAFQGFSPSHRREYIEWLTEAKTEETRKNRVATALEWIAEGKVRNWKYLKK